MKNLYIVIAILIVFTSCMTTKQPNHAKTFPSPFEYKYVDSVAGSKNEIYLKAYEWIAKSFNSAKDVIEMNDKESGKIILKSELPCHLTNYNSTVNDYVSFTLSIDAKDGRYRCVFSQFYHYGGTYQAVMAKQPTKMPNLGSLDNEEAKKNSFGGVDNERFYYVKLETEKKVKELHKLLKNHMKSKDVDF